MDNASILDWVNALLNAEHCDEVTKAKIRELRHKWDNSKRDNPHLSMEEWIKLDKELEDEFMDGIRAMMAAGGYDALAD